MNYWFDFGAWKGTSTQFFLDNYPKSDTFNYILLEPDINICSKYLIPKFYNLISSNKMSIYNQAIWTEKCEKKFYVGKHGRGSSLFGNKTTGKLSNKPIIIKCVGIEDVLSMINSKDYVVAKMNIEGAEYDILEYMLDNDLMCFINKLYVSWHWSKIGVSFERHTNVIKRIKEETETKLFPWQLEEDEEGNTSLENNFKWFNSTLEK